MKLAGALALGLISYWIGTKGEKTIVLTPEAKTEIKVVHDTLTLTEERLITEVDTLWKSAPDTCQRWVNHYKTLWERTRDSLNYYRSQSSGHIIVKDSTYNWLKLWGKFTWPKGEGGLIYSFPKGQPYFHKSKFSVGAHLKFFKAPDLELGL